MEIIETKSFKLASFSKGDKNSSKLAILLPGRLDTKDYINFISHANLLSNHGYYVLAIDPPGTWQSPGSIELFTTTNYIRAINELIDYFGNRPTLLLGHSRGAATAILVSDNPSVLGVIAIMANFGSPTNPKRDSLKKGFEQTYRDMPPGNIKSKDQMEFALPIAYWEDGKHYDVKNSLIHCAKPKLIIYGTNDKFTPTQEVEELYKIIPQPKMLKKIYSVHDYRYSVKAIKEIEGDINQFLKKYL
ncbi:MAG: alpha/beta fold hydrolase [Patescibacteria group bacterium]